jgi:hypothetical protein
LHREVAGAPDYGRSDPEDALYFILRYANVLPADGMNENEALQSRLWNDVRKASVLMLTFAVS